MGGCDTISVMIKSQLDPNEANRLATLKNLKLNLTLNEERFNRITRIASELFDSKIVALNLITKDRLVIKACVGVEQGGETDRDASVCTYTILQPKPFIVEDLQADERFRYLPSVTGPLHLRAYLGMALTAVDGSHPGSLCVMHTEPRTYSSRDISLIKDLVDWANLELNSHELRAAMEQRRQDQAELKKQLDQVQEMNAMMVDRELKMVELKEELAKYKA